MPLPSNGMGKRGDVGISPETASSALDFMYKIGERIQREGFGAALNSARADLRNRRVMRHSNDRVKKGCYVRKYNDCATRGGSGSVKQSRKKKGKSWQ